MPALHKIYVTPRTTNEGLRGVYGEDVVTVGIKKHVPADYFATTSTLMPPGVSVFSDKSKMSCHMCRICRLRSPPLPHYGGARRPKLHEGI